MAWRASVKFILFGFLLLVEAQSQIFINEIHYDNSGEDTGEAVEIAGRAGFKLAGWSLVLYNGNSGAVYDTVSLCGTLTDQTNGFGFAVFPVAGAQNGSPDGIGLVDPSGSVVEFLSYEGTLTATDGPAGGMNSTDIGVSETSSTPIGHSLQLTGIGSSTADFRWAPPGQNTFGAVNVGQSFGGRPRPQPTFFINEIHYDNTGSDVGERVEIAGTAGGDLDGWSLVLYNGSNGVGYQTVPLSGILSDQANGFGFAFFETPGLQNGAPDGLALVDRSGSAVEFLSYEGTFTAVDGPAVGLTSADMGVSETGSTPIGSSLQLGSGTSGAGFKWTGPAPSTFGRVNTGQSFGGGGPSPAPNPSSIVQIGQIQGAGHMSPLVRQQATTTGIVTATTRNGFYLQDPVGDGDVATSDATFVFTRSAPQISTGDQVEVRGSVSEFTPGLAMEQQKRDEG